MTHQGVADLLSPGGQPGHTPPRPCRGCHDPCVVNGEKRVFDRGGVTPGDCVGEGMYHHLRSGWRVPSCDRAGPAASRNCSLTGPQEAGPEAS